MNKFSLRLTKENILTIPNAMSFFRILLIAPIVITYYHGRYIFSVILIAISALSDIFDGRVARRFNMVSDFGKTIDPIADKLTQAALMICITIRYSRAWLLIGIFAVKELSMLGINYLIFKYKDLVIGAKWYGKVSTVIIESCMLILFLFYNIPEKAGDTMIAVCLLAVIVSFILYARFYIGILRDDLVRLSENKTFIIVSRIAIIVLWAVVIVFFICNRSKFTIDGIVGISSESMLFTALVMLFLFALKSVSIVVYSGLLYAASGILFPLPVALAVNIVGTAIMYTIPYGIGKIIGPPVAQKIYEKNKKLAFFKEIRKKNDFIFSFIMRTIEILPADPVSVYMGAVEVKYPLYLSGGILGFLSAIVLFTIMGTKVTEPGSREFIIALVIKVVIFLFSIVTVWLIKRRSIQNGKERQE